MRHKVVGKKADMRGNRMKNNLYWQKQVKGNKKAMRALPTKKKRKAFFKELKKASKGRHGRLTDRDLKGLFSHLGEEKNDPFTRKQTRRLAGAMNVGALKKRYVSSSEKKTSRKELQRSHTEAPPLKKKKTIADFSGLLRRGSRKNAISGINDAQWQEGIHAKSGTLSKTRGSFNASAKEKPNTGIDSRVSTSGNRSAAISTAGSLGHIGGMESSNLSNRSNHGSLSSFSNRPAANDSHYGNVSKAA